MVTDGVYSFERAESEFVVFVVQYVQPPFVPERRIGLERFLSEMVNKNASHSKRDWGRRGD